MYHWLYGYCMPNASYAMDVIWATGRQEAVGVTDSNGRTALMTVSGGHLLKGETMRLTCRYPGGDVV